MKTVVVINVFLVFNFIYSATCNAQVTGFVVDQQNNEPISGATISDLDISFGTTSDENGRFELNIPDFPVTIQISFVGFKTQQIFLESEIKGLKIELEPAIFQSSQITISADRVIINEQETRPVPVTRIKPSDLLMTIHASAPEMLRAEPGVYIQQTTIGQGSVYVRGRSGRDVLYLFNNFRMNPGFTRSGQNQYFAVIDPFMVDEIRVYRGPVSVFYGSDALSGGVHVKPFIPTFSDSTVTNGRLLVQTNFRGTGEKTGSVNISHQQNRFSLSLTGTLRDFRYYRMPASQNDERWFPYEKKLNLAEMNFGALTATGRFRINDSNQISAVSYYSRIPDAPRLDRMMMGYDIENSPVPSAPRSGYFSNTAPLVFSAHSITYLLSSHSSFFSSLRLRGGYHRLNDDRVEKDFAVPPHFSHDPSERNPTFTVSGNKINEINQSNQWLFSADFISLIHDNISLSWGTDVSREKILSSIRLTDHPGIGLPRYPDESEIFTGGLFLHADHTISRNFLLEYGLRYSLNHIRLPFEGRNTERGFDPMNQTFQQITAATGARYTLNRFIDVTGNLSTGFRAPNVADLAEIGIRRTDQLQTPNINLNPEKSINFDIGFHINSDAISFETYIFWLHYFDKIEREFTGSIVNRNGEFIREGTSSETVSEYVEVQSANIGTMNLFGIESGAEISFISSIHAGLNFNYIWGELRGHGGHKEPVDRVPPPNGLLYLSLEPFQNLTIRPQLRYNFSHRRLSPLEIGDNRISRYGTDGFVNVQFITVYEGIPSMQLKLFADNLLDTSYREHASSLDGLTRNVTVSLSYSF